MPPLAFFVGIDLKNRGPGEFGKGETCLSEWAGPVISVSEKRSIIHQSEKEKI